MMLDLFDLVNSFIEKGYGLAADDEIGKMVIEDDHIDSDDKEDADVEEMKDSLNKLFSFENGDEAIRKATLQVQKAWRHVIKDASSPSSSSEFKSKLMIQLRDQGFDAGLCKSKWKKNGRVLSGYYEYIDANINRTRYIIELSPAGEFEIARPTEHYASLLNVFPQIVVCKVKDFKRIVRIMCDAIRKSMHQQRMPVPPWRRYGYVQAKWFGSYERITNELSAKSVADSSVCNKGVIEFLSFPVQSCNPTRRKDFGGRGFRLEVGNLALVMNGAT